MRTLFEIVEAVQNNESPEYNELRYALLVYVPMFNSEHRQLREELSREKESSKVIKELRMKTSFDMYKAALGKSPKEFLGWNNDPENPEYQKFRMLGSKLIDKILEGNKS